MKLSLTTSSSDELGGTTPPDRDGGILASVGCESVLCVPWAATGRFEGLIFNEICE
jgi:hypothetical protein